MADAAEPPPPETPPRQPRRRRGGAIVIALVDLLLAVRVAAKVRTAGGYGIRIG
jgi:hypothetical protein